jgi:hypothetical protein
MDYKVIPNFLPENIFKSFTHFFLKERTMTYQYVDAIADNTDNQGFFFTRNIFFENNIVDNNPYFFYLSTPLLYHANITNLLRIKVNCFIKQPNHIFTSPHTDHFIPHKTFLYSLNTNNGFTILDPKGENIKIPSIANQALFFDGLIEHQAVTQTDEKVRINININYLP